MKRKKKSAKNSLRSHAADRNGIPQERKETGSGHVSSRKNKETKLVTSGQLSSRKSKKSKQETSGQLSSQKFKIVKNIADVADPHGVRLEHSTLPIQEIKQRTKGNLRAPKVEFIYKLTKDISKRGLLHPISIDNKNQLIAGLARLIALNLLSRTPGSERTEYLRKQIKQNNCVSRELSEWIDKINKLPQQDFSRINICRHNFNSSKNHNRARRIEISENDKTNRFDKSAIKKRYEELVAQGYAPRKVKPKNGALSAYKQCKIEFCCSAKTVSRALSPKPKKQVSGLAKIIKATKSANDSIMKDPHRITYSEEEVVEMISEFENFIRNVAMIRGK